MWWNVGNGVIVGTDDVKIPFVPYKTSKCCEIYIF